MWEWQLPNGNPVNLIKLNMRGTNKAEIEEGEEGAVSIVLGELPGFKLIYRTFTHIHIYCI